MHSYNENQQDALFTFNLIFLKHISELTYTRTMRTNKMHYLLSI